MIIYNYSSLQKRDTKIYNVGGYNIAGGFSVDFLTVVGPVFLVINFVGFLLSLLLRINFFNPFGENFIAGYTATFVVLGIAIGCGLWYIPISGYRLYQYLIAYLKPKKVYVNDFRRTNFNLTNVKIKAFVKNILWERKAWNG